MNLENLYGRVVILAKSCNNCPNDKNCCKIEVPGIGLLCLADKDTAYTVLQEKYDKLVIATGARPIRPDIPGVAAQGVYTLRTVEEGIAKPMPSMLE